jgi:Ni/Co efflux regulator RcnB
MKSRVIVCALMALSLGTSSLSFAQGPGRHGGNEQRNGSHPSERQPERPSTRGPQSHEPQRHHTPRHEPRHEYRSEPRHEPRHAQHDGRWNQRNHHYNARGPQFHRGGHIPYEYRNHRYVVSNYRHHHLSPPPRGHQWVQVGADYVLIAIATGLIAHIILSQ